MSDNTSPEPAAARVRARNISAIWLIPVVAAFIGLYLGWQALSQRGPLIAITFNTAQGLTAGQTKVRHKAVDLGTVESITLDRDMKRVTVRVRMLREAEGRLTDHARFWVVRPRLNARSLSGLDTLVSGAYLEMDPGEEGGTSTYQFVGLEDPPGVRSDEPGTNYVMRAPRIGSLGPGSPVFYRDVEVGEVLGYDLHNGVGPVAVNLFVRAPFDKLVHPETKFWNSSGLSVTLGPTGFHVEVESLQAVLAGGVAFDTPGNSISGKPADPGSSFILYSDKGDADTSRFRTRVPVVAYFRSSVSGLAAGSAVLVYGIQVGVVTEVRLLQDLNSGNTRVRVQMEVQPGRVLGAQDGDNLDALAVTKAMVAQGMRAELQTTNYLTGQLAVSLEFLKNPPPAEVTLEGKDTLVLPSQDGGLTGITSALGNFADKLDQLPIAEISRNLNGLLSTLNQTVGGDDMKQTIRNLSSTLATVQDFVKRADAGLSPALDKLPKIADDLQQTVAHANKVMTSVDAGYGRNSEFQSSVQRVLDQVNDTARSIRLLADFLDRHPEALIRGRAETGAER